MQRIAGAVRLLATGKLVLNTGFDGAQMQRRLMTWRAGGESINSLMLQGGELQRARARQLVRTNPYASNAAASFTSHAVGAGIKPSSLVEDGALKDQIQRLWLAWTDEADADGLTDFYGLQAMAARAMFEAGECFLRFRPRRPGDGLTVPLQLQMLSSEHLRLAKCETLPNGNEIIFGIELDGIGRRVAYHFHRTHPGDVRQHGTGELVRCQPIKCAMCSTRSPRARSAACRGSHRRWSAEERRATLAYVAEVHELCALAGRGDLAAGFVAKATPVAQVRRALLEARAAEDEATAIRSQVRPASVEPAQPAIDTQAIYAARNQNVR